MSDNSSYKSGGILDRLSAPQSTLPWSVIDATNAVSVLLIAVFLIGSAIASLYSPDPLSPTSGGLLIGWTIGNLITIAFVIITRRRTKESLEAMRLGHYGIALSLVLLTGFGAGIAVQLIAGSATSQLLPVPQLLNIGGSGIIEWITAGWLIVIAQPVAEEMIFRGILLPKMRNLINPWGGLITTTIAYAVFRFLAYGTQAPFWYGFISPLLIGLFFGAVRLYYNSTRAAIAAHVGAGLFWFLSTIVLHAR